MKAPAIAAHPDQVDAAWLTKALRAAGVIEDATVATAIARPVGNGLVGDSFRYALTYDRDAPGAPASVVGKFPAQDPSSRASGAALNLYLREVSFYRELAGTVGIITPRPYFAGIDPATSDFTLIFEDLGPARAGDQLTGCSLEDARTALLEAAALHAPRWGDPALEALPWLNSRDTTIAPILAMLPPVITAYKERYAGVLEPEFMALVDRLPAAMAAFNEDRSFPLTVQHGDFRLDNILFDIQGGARRMGTLDWQTVSLGTGLTDVSYFLSAGLPVEVRRQNERDLVGLYHAELQRLGVGDYGWDQCWRDYQRTALYGVFMGVFSAIAVERTERGDQLFLTMTRGGCAQALDHDTFGFWNA